jgi:hypothetical protein
MITSFSSEGEVRENPSHTTPLKNNKIDPHIKVGVFLL